MATTTKGHSFSRTRGVCIVGVGLFCVSSYVPKLSITFSLIVIFSLPINSHSSLLLAHILSCLLVYKYTLRLNMSSSNDRGIDELDQSALQMERIEAYMKIIAESQLTNANTLKLLAEQRSLTEKPLSAPPARASPSNSRVSDREESSRPVKRARNESGKLDSEASSMPPQNKCRRTIAGSKGLSALSPNCGGTSTVKTSSGGKLSAGPRSDRNIPGNMKNYDSSTDLSDDSSSVYSEHEANSDAKSDPSRTMNAEINKVIVNRTEGRDKLREGTSVDRSIDQSDDIENLQRALLDDQSESGKAEFPVIGSHSDPTWEPSEKVMKWYTRVADIELAASDVKEIKTQFTPPEPIAAHFSPPLVPPIIWNNIKSDCPDAYKQSALCKSQELIFAGIAPLLDALEKSDDQVVKNNVATSIQLLCTANLKLNRFRRALLSPLIKNEYRKSMLSAPITHNSLFGSSFDKCAEDAIKEQSNSHKVLLSTSQAPTPKPRSQPNRQQFFRHSQVKPNFKRDGGYRTTRGRGRPYRQGSSGRGRGHFH